MTVFSADRAALLGMHEATARWLADNAFTSMNPAMSEAAFQALIASAVAGMYEAIEVLNLERVGADPAFNHECGRRALAAFDARIRRLMQAGVTAGGSA